MTLRTRLITAIIFIIHLTKTGKSQLVYSSLNHYDSACEHTCVKFNVWSGASEFAFMYNNSNQINIFRSPYGVRLSVATSSRRALNNWWTISSDMRFESTDMRFESTR